MHALTIALAILGLTDPKPVVASTTTAPAEPSRAAFSYLSPTACVVIDGKPWCFVPGPNGRGVRLRIGCDSTELIDLGLDDVVTNVIGIAATSRAYHMTVRGVYIGLALESCPPGGTKREYRMAFGECYPLETAPRGHSRWLASEVLITRPAKEPFNMIAVSLIGGDSIMVTLQKLSRDPNTGNIETQVFVNHCPVGGNGRMTGGITQHFAPEPNSMKPVAKRN